MVVPRHSRESGSRGLLGFPLAHCGSLQEVISIELGRYRVVRSMAASTQFLVILPSKMGKVTHTCPQYMVRSGFAEFLWP